MTVTDVYGDMDGTSLVIGVSDERNAAPTVGAHRDQPTYYMRTDENYRDIYIDGCDNLSAFDTDNDSQDFSWSYEGPGNEGADMNSFASNYEHNYDADVNGWENMVADLVEGSHTFTFTTVDSYGASASSNTTFSIANEPGAPQPSIHIDHTGLRYAVISVWDNAWEDGDYDDDVCHGDVWDGDDGNYPIYNTTRLSLFNGDNEIKTWTDDNNAGSDTRIFVDESLDDETNYTYTVKAWNSEDGGQADDVLESSEATKTHDRPDVLILSPNGAEIRSVGDNYDVDFITYFDSNDNGHYDDDDELTNGQYISKIDVYYLADGQTEEKGDASCGLAGPDYAGCEGEDQSTYNGPNVNGCSNPLGGNSTDDDTAASTDCHKGDSALNYEISDNDGKEINYDAKVRVCVTDVGDYNGDGSETYCDDSDDPFTMAAHTIHQGYATGWNLVGPPLTPWDDVLKDNFSESLDQWGQDWVAYDVSGAYDGLTLSLGEGYYLALATDDTLTQHGDPVIADPDCNDCDDNSFALADLTLHQGWNLIANPLVNKVPKSAFEICEADTAGACVSEDLLFEDAVDAGWIAPTIYGWFGNSYVSIDRIMPFGGYWINASRPILVKVRPHLFDDGELTRKADDLVTSVLELRARDISGEGISDFITVGLAENADNKFVYGEDEYDLPRQAYASMGGEFIDMKVGTDLMKDMKSSEYDDYQAWTISIESEKVDNDIELSWGDVSGFADDLYMVVNGEAINMHEENYMELTSMIEEVAIVVGNVDSYLNPIPVEFGLSAAYPNPFNPTTNLGLALNADGFVSMSVFNIRGQVVEVLVDRNMKAGYHNITWNADGISSGMYFVRVETGANTAMQKLMLLK
jgi:hypothetical protein